MTACQTSESKIQRPMQMDSKTFHRFCEIAYERSGIYLRDGKEALVSSRIAKRMRALGIQSDAEYLRLLETDGAGDEIVRFLDCISTNYTHFYREKDHFELLAAVAKERLAAGQRRFRFWSAASSSGQEPYSIAITLAETLGEGADWRLLATDISTRMLSAAKEGLYPEKAVESVPKAARLKYFTKTASPDESEPVYQVATMLRERVAFVRLNLAQPPFPMSGPMDMVFCRNVMIYFDADVRAKLVSEIERMLVPGGYLAIGHTETLNGLPTGLKAVRPSVYRKA